MAQITKEQYEELKNRGLTDDKIKAIATQKGFELPKEGLVSRIFKSEKGFGKSIAGAIGGVAPSLASGKAVEESNTLNRQIQDNLLSAIKEKRAKGEDTTRLLNALKTMDSEINFYDILNKSTGGSLDKTGKQVFGEALGVVTDIAGAGALPGGVGQMAKATSIGSGIVQGAKAGAVGGAIFGGATGVSRGMQEDKTAGEIIGQGLRGGITGGLAGGAIGGAIGGIAGGVAGREVRKMNRQEKFALDLVSPKQTAKTKAEALAEGRVTEPGLLGKSRITASKKDVQIADAIKDYVSTKKSEIQNIESIRRGLDTIDDQVTGYVTKNKVPFNTNQLRSQIDSGKNDLRLIFTSDDAAEKTYDAVADEFMKAVQNKDTAGLLRARKDFDRIPAIKKLLDTDRLGENAKKEIVLAVRRSANEYVANQLPQGNRYRDLLMQESRMIEAIKNIAEKNISTIDKNKIQMLIAKSPSLKYVLGLTGAGVVGAGIGAMTSNR